ncbi:MAG: hypothetical protein L0K01_08070, partial [Brachybacterium sp.]|nr:hypothetical protein [Brachybacterium sp.]
MTQVSLAVRAPSANRVYAQAAGALALAEAHWVLGAHRGTVPVVSERVVGGMDALEVHTDDDAAPATAATGRLLGSLSSTLGVLDVVEEPTTSPAVSAAPLLRAR